MKTRTKPTNPDRGIDELESSLHSNFPQIDPQLKVLILYADEIARTQATRLCKHLMGGDTTSGRCLETFCWGLKHPKIIESVVEAVAMADMIIVAGCGSSELPAELQSALDVGLSTRRVNGGALVAFLGRANVKQAVPFALHISLQEIASRTGLNFFPGMFEVPLEKHSYNFDSIQQRAETITPTLQGILHHVIAPVDFATN